ncbi:MAG: hypothetical protein MJ252_14920 [archaeon]|nr:hypothetical protein [archaeon]
MENKKELNTPNDSPMNESEIINKEELSRIDKSFIYCTICTGIVYEPMMCTECQNSFCKKCIGKWYSNHTDCPFKCGGKELIEGKIIKRILSNIKFKCKNGCGVEIPYGEYALHYEEKCEKINFKEKYINLLNEIRGGDKNHYPVKDIPNFYLTSKYHIHKLTKVQTCRRNFTCGICCKTIYGTYKESYYCPMCNFDICMTCSKKEEKSSLNVQNSRINYQIVPAPDEEDELGFDL